jgi:concentrative nucleoside transporter, CNT family
MNMLAYFVEYNRYLNIIGIGVIFTIAYLFSKDKKVINFRLVFSALALHFAFALIMLRTHWGQIVIGSVAHAASKLSIFADKGTNFMFGKLADASLPWGFVFAIKVLPIIIFVGALMALFYHFKIIQTIVSGMNFIIRPLLGTSGVETVSAIANSILGQTEAALFISNYLPIMTKSELFVYMTSGMSSISIAVLVMYVMIGIPGIHLLTAAMMSVPAAIFIAKILLPETEKSMAAKKIDFEARSTNAFDAIAKGTIEGLKLAVAVAAMLISFLALIAMIDYLLDLVGYYFSLPVPLSIGLIFSYIFLPFTYLLGFTGTELWLAGKLLGIKIAGNELLAFTELVKINVSPRTFTILVYALCGFSNFSCIGIQIGMIGALAPEKRHTITTLGLYAVLGSALANLLSAMVVGLLL